MPTGTEDKMGSGQKNRLILITAIGIVVVAVILIVGTMLTGRSARKANEKAVRSVSMLYLEELAGRREQVVTSNLTTSINNMYAAIDLIDDSDLQDLERLQAFEARMKKLYDVEKFAFVDTNGLIYTTLGTETDIDQYAFDYKTISEPEISVKNLRSGDKKVIIAVPLTPISFDGRELIVSFMEIGMERMLSGVSLQSDNNGTTFCNIYTSDGVALTDVVLGGLASEDNLLGAIEHASFENGYSADGMKADFEACRKGVVSFTYNDILETMYYVPIDKTDWMLTYLIRESVISDQIGSISNGIIRRSLIQSVLTALVMLLIFGFMISQIRRNERLTLEKETSEAENRVKRQELENRLALQEQLLEQEKQRVQQDSMITALASDYRSVYYVDLDTDDGIVYRRDSKAGGSLKEGDHFKFHESFYDYAMNYVAASCRDGFLEFIDPDSIREGLATEPIITYRYLIERDGAESYEMLRMAGVRHAEDRTDHIVHAVGVGFTNVDREMRGTIAKNEALRNALSAAEEANKAKTAFLSSMSHEIRTPMNAIIGLDNIALSNPDISEETRDHLEKIGSSAQHLLTIINDILDMSRIESGRMTVKSEVFSFSKLLEQVNTMISGQCHEKGLHYNCQIIGHVDDYYIGDDMKLKQVLINILGNAVKFTPEGGSVSFTVEKMAAFDGKSTLKFMMADTGIGMSKEYLPRIFDSFSQEDSSSTSKYGSSGLGLAITKNFVEMMNGRIDVESEKGVGSTFTVTVTLMDSDRHGYDGEDAEIAPHEMCVLIVDDDPIACEHAKLVLEKVGIVSETAFSGAEAIEKARLRHARRAPYNLLLIDWKMPEMDGVEVTRRIREIVGNDSAIIILTAYRWDDVLDEATEAGVDSFIAKPLFASNVLEEFRQALVKKNIKSLTNNEKADLTGRRILLAEDVAINAEIIIMLLEMRQMEVEHAENGRIAVEMFKDHGEGYYDAILMDMRMPEMDGLQATAVIRAMDRKDSRSIPIIALTANAFDEDVQRNLQAGLNAHLSKPVEPDNLFETLESLIKN